VIYNVIDKKGGSYGYLVNYWHYSPGFVAARFIGSSFFGLTDLYSTCYWSYSNNNLADTKSI
jgi:hypothetical protein